MLAIFPEIINCAATENVEELAILMRRYFAPQGMNKPSLDVSSLIESMGIPISTGPLASRAAVVCEDKKGQFSCHFFINENEFTNIHEKNVLLGSLLGEFLFKVQPEIARGNWKTGGFQIKTNPYQWYLKNGSNAKKLQSDLALRFAVALLMPANMIQKSMKVLKCPLKCAQFFEIEENLLNMRLNELNISLPEFIQPSDNENSSIMSPKGLSRLREIAAKLEKT